LERPQALRLRVDLALWLAALAEDRAAGALVALAVDLAAGAAVALDVGRAGAGLRAGAFATVATVFLVERAVVVGAALAAAEALRPPRAGAALAVVALVARALVAERALVAAVRVAAVRPAPRAGALVAATLLAAALRPAAFLELSASLNPAAGLKRMPFDAAILTGWPVLGLRPVRALRCVGLKLPKP